MKLKPLILALVIATAQLSGVAYAQATKTPAALAAQAAPVATKPPVAATSPEELQRHFGGAIEAYAKKDYKLAASEIREANGYVRLEAGRASGEAKQALDSSVAELDKLAVSVEKGVVKTEKSMAKSFAKANHALALEHRAMATEAWAHKQYDKAGYELKAAAHGLERAADWAGGEAKAAVSAAIADTRSLGDKLVSGATWARDEVAQAFKSLGDGIDALGRKIGSDKKASPFDAGA